ncbi:Protein CBG24459 [Caenorhabditis briggsae]|uniref:Protein CBG24459 n=1 Tax=Caenorhabditis briggsae TaxID=6238 RepID=A8WKR6_CAEBR|nr:Protein CBG24459 [Caenorhabditis briggsae]CAP21061.2 Protein CBG24459 [Caenorhabditis briggsae]
MSHKEPSFFLKSHFLPAPECVFNHSEITSKTKKFFPKCGMVYGILVINSNTDLSLAQLKSVFKNMTTLVGGLIVENSSLSNLDFFTYPYEYLPFYCKTYGLVIRNNSKLTNGTMLLGTRFYSQNTTKECYVSIENNELLDMSSLCGQGELKDLLDIRTKGNFKNCGCQGNGPLSEFQNCNTTFNGLKLLNTTNLDLYPLSNITTIQGSIDIQNSNIQNLSFLTNWQFWTVKSNRTVILNLQNNPIMKRLGLPVLKVPKVCRRHQKEVESFQKFEKKLRGLGLANIENLHPEFCITIAEFKFIFEVLELSFLNLDAKICNEEIGDIRDNVLCHFESMYDLPYNCDIIVGNVIVDFGDEEYFSKLFNVWHLYGTLTIRNTNLKTFNRLQLSYIAYLDDRDLEQQDRLIQIYSNPKLNDFLMNSVSVKHHNQRKTRGIDSRQSPGRLQGLGNWGKNGMCNVSLSLYVLQGLLLRKLKLHWWRLWTTCGD